jgi:hypothetical protein
MGPLSEVRFQNVRADKGQTARLPEPRCTLGRTPLVPLVRRRLWQRKWQHFGNEHRSVSASVGLEWVFG